MKFLFDLFPVILFFVAFKLFGIYPATGVAIAATVAQIAWVRFRHGKVEPMQWISLLIIVVFGGATILLHNETFIKWKPTVLYWLFAVTLVASVVGWRKNLVRAMMEKQVTLPDPVWGRLNLAWAGFFAAMGVLNLYVAYSFDTDTWVNFKLFGSMGLMVVFIVGQSIWLSRHMHDAPAGDGAAEKRID
ncbi:septation protein A [Cupriavidus plantarum]|uniref:Inner membrane-spanning protein YciB n=1 Tax=Cupriavidus plantarum TaxID=942865 RepID=A0A316F103_9BURK|nr:septation protein A [Cupriavidus plantarum]NYH99968.1 intracellular septation protein [Cupriavidus plantarum]PWK37163.1 intracellular septation protein A [Cupriavidus plantarum]REF02100.1 intracellular septation protein A [Cupriavidus plantarum]RLK45054.1 intracellular septation protein A [Cupriavidus plantarum]CAG2129815.1 Intracellular septation protein [Cupriavidus plantarum]